MPGQQPQEYLPYGDAFTDLIANISGEHEPIALSSFDDFVQTVFAKAYPQYNLNVWHVRKICSELDLAFNDPLNPYFLGVLPRYHLKSFLLGYASSIYRMLKSTGEGLYISYKEDLANIHASHIKAAVSDNPILSKIFKDLSPQSDFLLNYKIGNKRVKIYTSGVFAVKRGLHTNLLVVGDDLMGDIQNPMLLTDIEKAKRLFDAEILNIPVRGCPLIVFGTVIDYNDLLFSLKKLDSFAAHCLWLPALNPVEGREVLWPEIYDKAWLEHRKNTGGWKAFSTEFLLTPLMALSAFLTRDELDKVIDKELINYKVPGFF